ncbi:hypothetical protein BH11BAC3_BH11BAC3_30590 [soil metagenome]
MQKEVMYRLAGFDEKLKTKMYNSFSRSNFYESFLIKYLNKFLNPYN